jgi:hypothetical protein
MASHEEGACAHEPVARLPHAQAREPVSGLPHARAIAGPPDRVGLVDPGSSRIVQSFND